MNNKNVKGIIIDSFISNFENWILEHGLDTLIESDIISEAEQTIRNGVLQGAVYVGYSIQDWIVKNWFLVSTVIALLLIMMIKILFVL